MVLKLKPLADRLVVEPTEQEETTASGIYVPETAKEKPQKGRVVAVGPGRKDDDGKRIPMDVAEGDRVLYAAVRRPAQPLRLCRSRIRSWRPGRTQWSRTSPCCRCRPRFSCRFF